MKFLDLNGLKHLLKFIDRTVSVANSKYPSDNIPFITNHQIIKMDKSAGIDVINWLRGASEGGILEIVFAGGQGGDLKCIESGKSLIYKMDMGDEGPELQNLSHLALAYNKYVRLIKSDGKLLVIEDVTNN
nr:MAG TPA: hypothetical protein [Caudoviricetes sp.]